MWLCKRDLSKKCDGKYKDCTDCVLDKIRAEIATPTNPSSDKDYEEGWEDAVKRDLNIIDKYK